MRLRQFDWKCESRDSGQVHGLGAEVLRGSLSSVVHTRECRVERRRWSTTPRQRCVTCPNSVPAGLSTPRCTVQLCSWPEIMNDRETIPGLLAGSNGASRGEERWNCHYCLSTVSTPGSAAVTRVQHVHLHGQHCPDICSDTLLRRTVTIVGLKYLFNARNKRIQRCSGRM